MEPVAGCDPHLDTFDVVAVDGVDRELSARHLLNTPTGWAEAVAMVTRFGIATVGIENASGYGVGLAQTLNAAGINVVDVPTRVTATGRRSTGGGKTDRGDARVVARAVLAGKGNPWRHSPHLEVLRVLTHRRDALVKDQTRDINQLRAFLVEVDPVHAGRLGRLRSLKAFHALGGYTAPGNSHHDPGRAVITELIRDLGVECGRRLNRIRELELRLVDALPPIGERLIATIDGCGLITAATLLAEMAGTDGFATDAKFATWCGVAPLDASSGRTQDHHRLNRGGNRQANRAIHTIVTTQLRHGGEAATYIQRRRSQGLTQRAAIRACKRHVARHVWKTLNPTKLT